MQLTPLIAIHMTAALGALVTGPVALWARQSAVKRPKLHRAFGYAWVTLMIATAASAFFIRDRGLPNLAGFTPIHIFIPVTIAGLVYAFWKLAQGNVRAHKQMMLRLYFGGCVGAGLFTMLPSRLIGHFLFA